MKYKRTYYVICDNETMHTCKTKKTAIKYARQYLDTLLYDKVTIDCLTIKGH